jgi:signal transduction histidine kinase
MPEGGQAPWFFPPAGEAGRAARAVDWAATPLGPIESWSAALITLLATLFRARQPMLLMWGESLTQFYNDAFLPSFGEGKHPRAMGQAARACWAEVWPLVGGQLEDAIHRGIPARNEDALVPILRNGRLEEVYWTYTYTPVPADGERSAGILVVCTETTGRVLAERRASLLQELGARTAHAPDWPAVTAAALATLHGADAADVPFAAIWPMPGAGAAGQPTVGPGPSGPGETLGEALRDQGNRLRAGERLVIPWAAGSDGPARAAPPSCAQAYLAPLLDAAGAAREVMVLGISNRLSFDESYRRCFEQIVTTVQMARTRVEEGARLAEVERERRTLLRNLEQSARAKDEFLAMLGHELRNPLAPILTALQLLRRKAGAAGGRELDVLQRQVGHLTRLVDDLLDVAKIARGKVELRREIVDACDAVAKAVEMVSDLLERRRHSLLVDCPRGRYFCLVDPVRLSQVLANLLSNAAKYTEPGGHIALTVARVADRLEVTVRDDGIGIAGDLLPRVFDLFEQGQRSADRAEGGLGIGLALVKNLVALHGGSVEAHSDGPGRGSRFVVRLPALEADAGPAAAAPPLAQALPGAARPRRVLVVDDNSDAAELLKETLEAMGHEVAMATEPVAALDLAARFIPEVAVLDIGLPVIDGYELAARLRAAPATRSCRLIALTGYGQEHDHLRSREAGFEQHLVKPVDVDRLLALVAG